MLIHAKRPFFIQQAFRRPESDFLTTILLPSSRLEPYVSIPRYLLVYLIECLIEYLITCFNYQF